MTKPRIISPLIRPSEKSPDPGRHVCLSQGYFTNRLQLADVLAEILQQTGPAELTISTFSTSDDFLRRLYRLRQQGLITRCALYLDLKATRKTALLKDFLRKAADYVALCNNHSKVTLISNDTWQVAVVSSQNQTSGSRAEAGIITTEPPIFQRLSDGFRQLQSVAVSLDEI